MDRKWRQDASDYMSDAEYQQWQAKKEAYLHSQQNPMIQKLAESYKERIPSSQMNIKPKSQSIDTLVMPVSAKKAQNVQESVREATGYSEDDPRIEALRKLLGQ